MSRHERSSKGKKRLAVCGTVGLVLLGAVLMYLIPVVMPDSSMKDTIYDVTKAPNTDSVKYGPSAAEGTFGTITRPSNSKTFPSITPAEDFLPNSDISNDMPGRAGEVQDWIISLMAKGNLQYGSLYGDVLLVRDSFASIFYKVLGNEIDSSQVTIGDVAIGCGYSAVCVGFYCNHPVYAYVGELSLNAKESQCIFLGFDRNDYDQSLGGRYPITFEQYYDCCTGEGYSIDSLIDTVAQSADWYSDVLYQSGVAISKNDMNFLLKAMPPEILEDKQCELIEKEFEEYIKSYKDISGCASSDFTYHIEGVYPYDDNCSIFAVSLASLNPNEYLKSYGYYYVTLYHELNAFFPLNDFTKSSFCGIYRRYRIAETNHPDSVEPAQEVENHYGYFYDDDGNYCYRDSTGTIYIGINESDFIIENNSDFDSEKADRMLQLYKVMKEREKQNQEN